jgi:hypothetical protein
MRTACAFAVIGLLALASAAPAAGQDLGRDVVAVVNGQTITILDVRDRMREILNETGVRPTEELLLEIQERALDELIVERGGDPETAEILLGRPDSDEAPSQADEPR